MIGWFKSQTAHVIYIFFILGLWHCCLTSNDYCINKVYEIAIIVIIRGGAAIWKGGGIIFFVQLFIAGFAKPTSLPFAKTTESTESITTENIHVSAGSHQNMYHHIFWI